MRFNFVLTILAKPTKENTVCGLHFEHFFALVASKKIQIFQIDRFEG
jgi:hypothetical protein